MNPIFGWALAAVAVAAGWQGYGWPGVALAVSVIAFWLLMQFNRSLRVLRNAGSAPIGHIDSAVMLNAKLQAGMPMIKVVALTKSLGRRVSEEPEQWAWADPGGSEVVLSFDKGICRSWVLNRPADATPE
ncbi:MAG: hypothetical protein Q8R33_23680 [Burkholderiales bacterium]|nr:hypothetical protein [Burkholderiales bacterium]